MRIRTSRERTGGSSRELASLTLGFIKIRILHYAATQPVDRAAILSRLRRCGFALSAETIDQAIASLTRNGWLKKVPTPAINAHAVRALSLTSAGHRVLEKAKEHLSQLVETL